MQNARTSGFTHSGCRHDPSGRMPSNFWSPKTYKFYVLENPELGRRYVGVTSNLDARARQHGENPTNYRRARSTVESLTHRGSVPGEVATRPSVCHALGVLARASHGV